MGYSGFFVFGDSLVDSGNALKLAQLYGDLTFSDLPEGAPSAADGYFAGRFSDGYNFADLVGNKTIGNVTSPVFPFGYVDPWLGVEIDPFASDPKGNNLNFAYGGAQIRQGDEMVPDLDGQTDAFKDAIDNHADAGALYLVTIGGNDVRSLAPGGSDPATQATGYAALDASADKLLHELAQLVDIGVHNLLITGIPDVGLIPNYDRDGNDMLDSAELARSQAATDFSRYLDTLIRTEVIPALQAMGAKVTYVPMMDYVDASGQQVTGALSANLPAIAALHGLTADQLASNLLQYQDLVFFDQVHPNAQANALLASFINAQLSGAPWVETLPLSGADVDYSTSATIAVKGEVDTISVALVAGTTYRFEMLGVSSLGAAHLADPSVRLLGPAGTQIGADDDSGAGLDAMLSFTAPTTGTYTLQLTAIGSVTGAYSFQAAVVAGAATLAGNTYLVSNPLTVILEGAGGIGQDVVKADVSFALSVGSEIEVLRTGNDHGKTAINLTGNEFAQALVGNSGTNILDGKGGDDTLTGGAGNDVFVLGTGGIDRVTDYAKSDLIDVAAKLSVAPGTNVLSGGYLRVTASGLVQVDANGGGDQWITLGQVNGSGTVALRYLSGGLLTTLSAARVADTQALTVASASSSAVMTGAIAAAGLLAAHDAGTTAESSPQLAGASTTPLAEPLALTIETALLHPALANETRLAAFDEAPAARPQPDAPEPPSAGLATLAARGEAHAAALSALPGPNEPAAHALPLALPTVAPALLGAPAVIAQQGAVASVVAEAIDQPQAIDALLAALPGHGLAHAALAALAAAATGESPGWAGFVLPHMLSGIEQAMIHPDVA